MTSDQIALKFRVDDGQVLLSNNTGKSIQKTGSMYQVFRLVNMSKVIYATVGSFEQAYRWWSRE